MNAPVPPHPEFKYPDLPISRRRAEIADALRRNQVVIVVGETGSGKTTQLPKIALEVAGNRRGRLGCTQPRRLAAVAVARRIAEETGCEPGEYVGYQVRFDDHTGSDTKLKLMTDGILLAETQNDRDLKQYHTIIIDEAHERSLNIDFLLGYMKLLLKRRRDLKLIISSATMDAAAFADFFGGAPVINVKGRTFPVELHYMPALNSEEELTQHVARAVRWLSEYDNKGDVLVFLPGEREIRECADELAALELPKTDILPLFARMGIGEQQRIFRPSGGTRRIVLATNVAETSLTIPGIIYVIDSGYARISRYLPGRQIQRLQVECISQASARQRTGRCGRITEGVCIRLYSENDFGQMADFTDPEIKRSSLAGVILRMADLKLPPLGEFPLPDPPSARLISEGYRTLREIGAIDRNQQLTDTGRTLARLPLDPRLGRMLLEAQKERALPEMLVIVAGLTIMDPRERPAERETQADQAHAKWKDADSDFTSMLRLWRDSLEFRDKRGLRRNQLRRWCDKNYLNFLRMIEWHNLVQDIGNALTDIMKWRIPALAAESEQASPAMIHRSVLAGCPLQFGVWRQEDRVYRGAGGRDFAIFPGSGLFRRKRTDWVMGTELVETSRLWMRRVAVLDPLWVEQVAPQICSHHAYDAAWDKDAGVVYAKERVTCGGLTIVDGRRISYARCNPAGAREIMIREGIMGMQLNEMPDFLRHLDNMREDVREVENKLRRRDLIWSPEGVFAFFDSVIPADCCCAKDLRQWRLAAEKKNPKILCVPYEDCVYPGEDDAPEDLYPNEWLINDDEYPIYYSHNPGGEDDGVYLAVDIEQLETFPDWLPSWGVPAHLAERAEILLRTLPKDMRNFLMPIAETADAFADIWETRTPDRPITRALAEFVMKRTGKFCNADQFDESALPPDLITKIWVTNENSDDLALGSDINVLREKLADHCRKLFHSKASRTFSATPMTRWDCGDLPESVDLGNGKTGYPALLDDGTRVRIHVFPSPESAEYAHRLGVRRLALIRLSEFINRTRKKLPLSSPSAKIAMTVIGAKPAENPQDTILAAMDDLLDPLPRCPEDFDDACEHVKACLYDSIASDYTKIWDQLAAVALRLKEFTVGAVSSPATAPIAIDLQAQWQWLTRSRFLSSTPPEQRNDIMRFTRGIAERLRRINEQPIARELERIKTFRAAMRPDFYTEFPRHADDPSWLEYGRMLEEFRLGIFAPALAVKGRASTKKLAAILP